MKKILLLLIVFATSVFTLFAQPIYNEDGIQLHHTPSQAELDWAKSKGMTIQTVPTAPPPVGQLRPIAEFEPAEGVLIRYTFGIPMDLIKKMAAYTKVITIVASESQKTTVLSQYNSNGVNVANCEFLIAANDSYWTRDYGPWFMAVDDQDVAMFDFTYNRPVRPNDNQVNGKLATYLSNDGTKTINRYASSLQLTGGNFMNDGIKQAYSTTLTTKENSGYTTQQIKDHFLEYMGIEQFHFIEDPINPYDNIQHIDCWSKLLAPDKVLVAQVPNGSMNYAKFEAAADYFASLTSSYGTPMQVFRVNEAAINGSSTNPYTNSLILNDKVFVPTGGNSYDAPALQLYKDAMPGYEIVGIPYNGWLNTDALHCRTHEIADRCMLYVKHQPLLGDIENTGSLTFSTELYSYCDNTIYSDSALVYLKHDGGEYQKYNMEYQGDNKWEVTVYGLPGGLIEYYVFAADESGRRESHPYIARYAPDVANVPHKFNLSEPPALPILSLDKTSSSVSMEGYGVVEDYIVISNVGNGDLEFEIADIDFSGTITVTPLAGTVQPGSSETLTLSYDFTAAKSMEFSGSFNILSNSFPDPVVEISLFADLKVPVLSLDKTSSSVTLDEITIIEDYIIVSNDGEADLEFEIADIDFPEKLTVSPLSGTVKPDDSQIITLTYEFDYAKNKEYDGSFNILSNDAKKPEVEITLSATIIVGITEAKSSTFNVYPNPTSGELTIEMRDMRYEICDIAIFDVFGKKVSHLTISHPISISSLPAGVYFLRIQTENEVVTKKVIKN